MLIVIVLFIIAFFLSSVIMLITTLLVPHGDAIAKNLFEKGQIVKIRIVFDRSTVNTPVGSLRQNDEELYIKVLDGAHLKRNQVIEVYFITGEKFVLPTSWKPETPKEKENYRNQALTVKIIWALSFLATVISLIYLANTY